MTEAFEDPPRQRIKCYRCFWPKEHCWCDTLRPMPTATRFVFLMHPKEFKREKLATGRLTHLCLPESEIIPGIGFDENERVQQLIRDPERWSMLVYPGEEARNLSQGDLLPTDLQGRKLTLFLIDATWTCARKMLRQSKTLQALDRVMFTPRQPSRYRIKRQPQEGCLSTLERTHELLLALRHQQLDDYRHPEQLLEVFERMQNFQLQRASDPNRTGYRLHHETAPQLRSTAPSPRIRRRKFLPD